MRLAGVGDVRFDRGLPQRRRGERGLLVARRRRLETEAGLRAPVARDAAAEAAEA